MRRPFRLSPLFSYRRALPLSSLEAEGIRFRFRRSSCLKITRERFLKIVRLLKAANFPQMSSDLLLMEKNGSSIQATVFVTYPETRVLRQTISINSAEYRSLLKLVRETVRRFQKCPSPAVRQEISFRISRFFWEKADPFQQLSGRFVAFLSRPFTAALPLEWPLLTGSRRIFLSRVLARQGTKDDPGPPPGRTVSILFPRYEKFTLARAGETRRIRAELSGSSDILEKKISRSEFTGLLEKSYVLYFSGHSLYNRVRKEYGLRLNDRDIFYFSEFRRCLRLPALIFFNSCFDDRRLGILENSLAPLFGAGTQNIVIPFMPLGQEQPCLFVPYLKGLKAGLCIAEAHDRVSRIKELQPLPLFFRLYGSPMQKYFQKQ